MRRAFFLLFAVAISPLPAAAQQEGFIGAEACGACHPDQQSAQTRSGHARSLSPALKHPLADQFTGLSTRLGDGFEYSFALRDQILSFHVQKGEAVHQKPVDWAFGAGQQAVTFVSRLDEDNYIELRTSFYPGSGLSLTPGHQNQNPETVDQALGVEYKIFSPRSEILSCFGCHSTGLPSLGEAFEILPAELGVRCESCHGPGRTHADLIAKGEIESAKKAIGNPARLEAAEQMKFCGECHRPPASDGVAIDWSDPWNVRHQPVYLTQSLCFQKAGGALSCMTCHDPHEPMRRDDAAYYNARCASCHDTDAHPATEGYRAAASCASCHMPAVRPQRELVFHNHWIGVYEAGEASRPQR